MYITQLYANRRVYFRLPGEPAKNEHYMKDVATTLGDEAFSDVRYTKANGEESVVYVADMTLKIKNLGKRRVLIVKPTLQEKNIDNLKF